MRQHDNLFRQWTEDQVQGTREKYRERVRIRMVFDKLSHFLFIGGEFEFGTTPRVLGSDASRLLPLFNERIRPRATDVIVIDKIFDRDSCIIVIQNPFT